MLYFIVLKPGYSTLHRSESNLTVRTNQTKAQLNFFNTTFTTLMLYNMNKRAKNQLQEAN
jgi:hypothetical protein